MPQLIALAYLLLLAGAVSWIFLVLILFNAPGPHRAAERLHIRLKKRHMANFVGGSALLNVVPDGALASDPQESVFVSDSSVLSLEASPDGNPLNRKVNFLAAGLATISATAFSSNGSMVQGSLDVIVEAAAATTLTLSLSDLP